MNADVTKIAFEASYRYFVALTDNGSISVWKLKGDEAKHFWDLNFNTVTDVVANTAIEN